MKKYSSGSFVDAAVRVYGSEADTISSFPATIYADGGNITPWTIYGNTSGGLSVGEKTTNLCPMAFSHTGVADDQGGTGTYDTRLFSDLITVSALTNYSCKIIGESSAQEELRFNRIIFFDDTKTFISRSSAGAQTPFSTFTTPNNCAYISMDIRTSALTTPINESDISEIWLVEGTYTTSTMPPYEPYGYKLPVVIGSTTTNIYMADVLRMSSGADPVYDVMSSTGVITRNVDTDGSPLPTPTTESFTAPTLATVAGSQSFTIDTTVKPSSVSLTYTGWHTHSDKQYSGGQWGQVTSNAKVLRRKRTAKSKT